MLDAAATRYEDRSAYDVRGRRLPAVTRILRETEPPERAKRLAQWVRTHGRDYCDDYLGRAQVRGAAFDEAVADVLGGRVARPEVEYRNGTVLELLDLGPYLRSVEGVLAQIAETIAVQHVVADEVAGYAGTLDVLAYCKAGRLQLLEFKTWDNAPHPGTADARAGKRRSYGADKAADHKLQAAAYTRAMERTNALAIPESFVVVALPDRPARVFEVDVPRAYAAFRDRLALWQRLRLDF